MKHMPPFKRAGALQKQASPEEAWQSARDGEPFIVHYGLPVSANSGLDVPVIAFEAHGDGEHRYVAFANGKVKRVSEEDMKQCLRDQQ